jgi:hypothetical protein
MRVTSEFQAGGATYQVNMWHPDKAIENMTWLMRLAGEPLVALVTTAGSLQGLMDSDADLAFLTPAVKSLVMNLNEKEVVLKVRSFTEGLLCDGAKVTYETHFMGRPGHLIKVLAGVLRAQYADFFDGLPADLLKRKAAESTTTPAPLM